MERRLRVSLIYLETYGKIAEVKGEELGNEQ